MATTVANLTAVISANNTKFKKGVGGANRVLDGFKKSVMALGPAIASAFAVTKIISFGKESMRLYDVQARAERSLLVALKGRKAAQQDLINQAQSLQKETLFGDEETIRAQSLIAAFVEEEEQIKKVIPLVQDMATAKGMDLAGAADLVSKTLGSSTNALSRYGIEVTGAVGSTERLDSLVRGLSDAFEGQAKAAAEEGTGAITQFSNSMGDLKEDIGEVLISISDLNTKVKTLTLAIDELNIPQLAADFKTLNEKTEIFRKIIRDSLIQLSPYNKELSTLARLIYRVINRARENKDEVIIIDGEEYKIIDGFNDSLAETGKQYKTLSLKAGDASEEIDDTTKSVTGFMGALNEPPLEYESWMGALLSDTLEVNKRVAHANKLWEYRGGDSQIGQTEMSSFADGIDADIQALLKLEPAFEKVKTISTEVSDTMKDLRKDIGRMAASAAGDLAFAFGEAAAGMDGFGDKLAELSIMIAGALGDILIAAGINLGITGVGLPLIVAGLGLKLGAGLLSGMNKSEGGFLQTNGLGYQGGAGSSMLYGNDIRTSYDYAASNKSRVG